MRQCYVLGLIFRPEGNQTHTHRAKFQATGCQEMGRHYHQVPPWAHFQAGYGTHQRMGSADRSAGAGYAEESRLMKVIRFSKNSGIQVTGCLA